MMMLGMDFTACGSRQVGSLALARFHVVRGFQACDTDDADNQGRHYSTCPSHCLYHFTTTALHSVTGSRIHNLFDALARKCLLEERPRSEHETALQAPTNDLQIQQSLGHSCWTLDRTIER